MKTSYYILLLLICLSMLGCPADDDEMMIPPPPPPPPPPTEVSFNLEEVPYANLSDYRFYVDDLKDLSPNEGVLAYKPISTLFSDYAKKSRHVWFPEGTMATYNQDDKVLDFPDGSVIIKTFYYDNVQPANTQKILETRLLYKQDGEWKFADYYWNDEQTEATYSLEGENVPLSFIDDGGTARDITYRIPSESECLTCHKTDNIATPIGPKPQNLNSAMDYADGNRMNQLVKWQEVGYLAEGFDLNSINTVVDWHDETQELALRVRSYLDMNCSSCHREGGHCDYRPIRLAFSETENPINLGVCVPPDEFVAPGQTNIITPGRIAKSALYYRLNTNEVMARMPLLGRSVIHDEAVTMIEEWIGTLTDVCD